MSLRFLITVHAAVVLASVPLARGAYLDENFELKRNCTAFYSELGVQIEKSISPTVTEVDSVGGRFAVDAIPNYKPKALYIGVANHPIDGGHHYYLMANGQRFDGWPLYRKPRFKKSKIGSQGVVFEFDVPEETLQSLQKNLSAYGKYRSITCAHALCRLLEDSGFQLGDGLSSSRLSAKWLALNLVEGNVRVSGQPLGKENIRWLATDSNQAREYLIGALEADAKTKEEIKSRLLGYGLVTSLPMMGGAYYLYILVHPEHRR